MLLVRQGGKQGGDGRGSVRTELKGVDGFWRDVGRVDLAGEFGIEGHC